MGHNWGWSETREQNFDRFISPPGSNCLQLITCNYPIQTAVHPIHTKFTFHWKLFISGEVYFQLKHATETLTHARTRPLTSRWLQQHPEPSTALHREIQSTKWRNNTRQQYGSVLPTTGLHSGKCVEFQNTTSFLQCATILNKALCL